MPIPNLQCTYYSGEWKTFFRISFTLGQIHCSSPLLYPTYHRRSLFNIRRLIKIFTRYINVCLLPKNKELTRVVVCFNFHIVYIYIVEGWRRLLPLFQTPLTLYSALEFALPFLSVLLSRSIFDFLLFGNVLLESHRYVN